MTVRRLLIATAVLLTACEPIASGPATPSPSVPPSPSAQPSVSLSATAAPTPTSDPSLADVFQTQSTGWRPTTATLMVFELDPSGHGGTLIAVPLDGSSPTKLIGLQEIAAAIRPDGGAVAVPSAGGIAVWEPSGVARWLVPPEQTTVTQSAVWAPDGAHLYFGRVKPVVGGSAEDLGIFRVRADGSGLQKIVDGQPPGQAPPFNHLFSVPRRITPENILIWGHAYEGATIEVLDLANGRSRTYESGLGGVGDVLAWRSTQPRALIEHCMIGGCRGLVEWNDETGATRPVFSNEIEVRGADREPSGARIVVARRTADWGLDLVDGASVARIPGTGNAQWPRWLDAGIAYFWGPEDQGMGVTPLTEIRMIGPTGGTPRVLYRALSSEHNLLPIDVVKH